MKTSKILKLYTVCVIIALLAGNAAFCATAAIRYYRDLYQNIKSYGEALEIYDNLFTASNPSHETDRLEDAKPLESVGEITEPSQPSENKVLIDKLREHFGNDDIFAYIKIGGTNIDCPVVRSYDNSFYIGNNIYGNPSACGAIFMDYENDIKPENNLNTVIYGHNMKDSSMFHSLKLYTDKDYYNPNKFISVKTENEDTLWEIFSFYITDTGFDYIKTRFENTDEFYRLVREMKEKSLYDTGIEIGADDRVLTLSTCTNTAENMRYVVHAKLISKIN